MTKKVNWDAILDEATDKVVSIGLGWLREKARELTGPPPQQTIRQNSPVELPAEFRDTRSHLATEIPGQKAVSDLLEMQREMQEREQAVKRMNILSDHMRNMNAAILRNFRS